MRILITGGAGCLGSNLTEYWLGQGIPVCVIDNFATGKRESLPDSPNLSVTGGSVADAALVSRCMKEFGPTHVIHGAASYKNPADWEEDVRSNISGTINVVRAAEAVKAKRLVYLQTALCYGRPQILPTPAGHPLAPIISYSISKTAGEQYALMSSVPALSLRIACVTGPRLVTGPIPTFYKRLKNGQNCFCSDTSRDFLDMEDFFAFMDKALPEKAPTGIFNVASGKGHSIREIYDIVADHLQVSAPEPPLVPCGEDDVPAMVLDPAATEQAFDWRVTCSFEQTVRRLLAWYDRHGVTDIYGHLIQRG